MGQTLVLREWRSVARGHAAYDRVAGFNELVGYVPSSNVIGYEFMGMEAGTVHADEITNGRTLEGKVLQRGQSVLVGSFRDTQQYLDSLPEETARGLAYNFSFEIMCGVCVHPDGSITEVRGHELIYDPETQGFEDIERKPGLVFY